MEEWIKKYWIEVVFGAVVSAFGAFSIWVKKRFKESEAVKFGVQALLRNEIIKMFNDYMDKGYCPIYARENITNMYNRYHDLGGNGTATDLVKKLFELPTEKPEKVSD